MLTKEVIDLYCVTESEKLMTRAGGEDWQKHVSAVRFGFRIIKFATHNHYNPHGKTVLLVNEGFKLENFVKWKWYFRYRQAIWQVENPRNLVQLQLFSYYITDRNAIQKDILKNRIIAAKREVTKLQNSITKASENYNEIFPIDENKKFQEAMELLSEKKEKLSQLEKEFEELN